MALGLILGAGIFIATAVLGERNILWIVGVVLIAASVANAVAGPYEDCILQNMKGAQIPQAVVEIRKACQQKADEEKRMRVQEFGESLDKESYGAAAFKAADGWEIESPGFHAMRFTNATSDKTITYARLWVAQAEGDEKKGCDRDKGKVYAYTLVVKPGQSVRLIYPSAGAGLECVLLQRVLGRSTSWADVSFSSSVMPAAKDPLANIE